MNNSPPLVRSRSYTLGSEDDTGNVEYKRHLLTDDADRIDKLTTQLSYRLLEGNGQCQYRLGVEDDGCLSQLHMDDLEKSIALLEMMVESISAKVESIDRIEYQISDSIIDSVDASSTADSADADAAEGTDHESLYGTDTDTSKSPAVTYFYALVNIESCYEDDTSND